MAKLPITPDLDRLRQLPPNLISLPAATTLYRVYRRGGGHPTLWNTFRYYGPTAARFDHQTRDAGGRAREQTRGIIYFAADIPTALAEVFQEGRTVDRFDSLPWLASMQLANALSLLDLTGTFCVKAGGSMKLFSGPTIHAQNWSRAFYERYENIHGLYYPSSLTNRPAIAIYERALNANLFPPAPELHRELSSPLLINPLRNACNEIGYDFI